MPNFFRSQMTAKPKPEPPATLAAPAGSVNEDQLDAILSEIRAEVLRARRKHKPMNSPHEGYAVLQEEVDELWEEVKRDNGRELVAMEEAVQVAAMGVRYVMDLSLNEKGQR